MKTYIVAIVSVIIFGIFIPVIIFGAGWFGGLFEKAMSGNTVNTDYQTWIVYSDNGGKTGTAYARLCTIQMSSKTATANEKRGYEFDILPVGDTYKVTLTAEKVDETSNEITVTASAASV